jgi:predicted lipoprotein with Yx(FWY)xxD motif
MSGSKREIIVPARRRRHGKAMLTAAVAAASVLALSFVAVALASATLTIGSASNSKLGERVVVNSQGRTLYALSGESRSHQFCTSAECLKFWPPLRVSSRSTKLKAGSGVHGKLGVIARAGGILQVTLRGLPLYRFSGDRAKGEANGEGITLPGGHVWHAVTAASSASPGTPAMSPSPPNASPPNPSSPSPSPNYPAPGYGY